MEQVSAAKVGGGFGRVAQLTPHFLCRCAIPRNCRRHVCRRFCNLSLAVARVEGRPDELLRQHQAPGRYGLFCDRRHTEFITRGSQRSYTSVRRRLAESVDRTGTAGRRGFGWIERTGFFFPLLSPERMQIPVDWAGFFVVAIE